MKSEHRHELKTNELSRIVAQATPFLERYSNYILVGLGVIIVAGAVAVFLANRTSPASAGWTAMLEANTAEDYANLADNYPNTEVGDWARLIEAESYLENGIRTSFTNREAAISDLNKAQGNLDELMKKSGISEGIRKRALFASARCAETRGEVEQAIELYKQLAREYDDPVYKELADSRVADLETGEAKDFYAWFRKQNPKPEDRQQPRDGMSDPFGLPPGHPPTLTLPEIPEELKLPEDEKEANSPGEPAGPAETDQPESPAADAPANGTSAPDAPEKNNRPQSPAPSGTEDESADKSAPSEK